MSKRELKSTKSELILKAYKSALDLKDNEGSVLWSRFNAIIVGQSIFLLSISTIYTIIPHDSIFVKLLAGSGIITCLFWLNLTARGFSIIKLWTLLARKYEEQLKDDDINILRIGDAFNNNHEIEFIFKDISHNKVIKYIQRQYLTRIIDSPKSTYLIILSFIIIYSYIFLKNI